jgi:hypothetical protein
MEMTTSLAILGILCLLVSAWIFSVITARQWEYKYRTLQDWWNKKRFVLPPSRVVLKSISGGGRRKADSVDYRSNDECCGENPGYRSNDCSNIYRTKLIEKNPE